MNRMLVDVFLPVVLEIDYVAEPHVVETDHVPENSVDMGFFRDNHGTRHIAMV